MINYSVDQAIDILSRTPLVIHSLLNALPQEWLHNNEGENTWSPYDVVGHLIHGEKTDWIPRAKIILSNADNKQFEPFDRFAQMQEKNATIAERLLEFKHLREDNIRVLKEMAIDSSKLSAQGVHPELGPANLQQLLSTWVVHDLGHITQISRVMAKQYSHEVGPWQAYLSILKS